MSWPGETAIRAYEGGDEPGIIQAWNRAMPYDTIDLATFAKRVLCDPNFQRQGLFVARVGGEIAGFILAIERRLPLHGSNLDRDLGWITAFAVVSSQRGQGIGGALLRKAEEFLAERGKKFVSVSAYAPNYFWPGIDRDLYPDAYDLLVSRGYAVDGSAISMDKNLVAYAYPDEVTDIVRRREEEGYRFSSLDWSHVHELVEFSRIRFNADWARAIREGLSVGVPLDRCRLAMNAAGRIVGFALYGVYDHVLERFGPFGVDERERGKGLGKILLHDTLIAMKSAGLHCAWFLWTGERTAAGHLYKKAGFVVSRTFHIMRKRIG